MIKGIEIHGNEDSILSVNLEDILNCIAKGQEFKWSILWLEAVGHLQNKTMLEFEEEIKKSINGYYISREELLVISKSFEQIIEITLIADKNQSILKRYENDNEMYSACELTIELVDSSYWVIYSNNNSIGTMFDGLKGVKRIN